MPLAVGQVIHARYRIARLIGQGGFGAVYRAWDLSLKQPCAVKENLDASPEAQRQFEREATILAGLRHSNLPRVTDYFFLPGQGQYLVMDFVEGNNLVEAVRQYGGPLPESRALDWIEQVCAALTYLHSQNPPVIHRDIKPQNIIITPVGQALLVDFGISKIYDPVLSTTGGARGVTPAFSPPEQYGRARTDPRSDLYSLAATLYFLLTTHEPPDAMDRIVHGAPLTSPRQHNPAITPAAEQAILRALEIESGQRYSSIKEFRQALEGQVDASSSVQLRQPSSASAPATPPLTPGAPQIRILPAAQHPSYAATPPAQAVPATPVRKRPRGVTAVAVICIVIGLIISIESTFPGLINFSPIDFLFELTVGFVIRFIGRIGCIVFGLASLIGGILMLLAKNQGRQIGLVFLGLLIFSSSYRAFMSGLWGYGGYSIYTALLFLSSIYSFFYLFHSHVQDYFSSSSATHPSEPARMLDILGRLHILLGFWLVLPILIGVGMVTRRSRDMWWSAYLTTSLLCLASLIAIIMSLFSLWFVGNLIDIVSLLVFALESQVWLYLRRSEVRQQYP